MSTMEEQFAKAVSNRDIPGAILAAASVKGDFSYTAAFGTTSLQDPNAASPLTPDSTLWLASCTKLLASIAALQCVERGYFTLDEDVTRLLPELRAPDVLKGFDEKTGQPILVTSMSVITLRHLLTHSSGVGYDIFHPELTKWRRSQGKESSLCAGTILERSIVPLLFEPGEGWVYSTGLDWAGLMVERTNNMSLGAYMEKYIWAPLGIKNMTFHLEERPDMAAQGVEMSQRIGGVDPIFGRPLKPDEKVEWAENHWWRQGMTDDSGGAGAYGTVTDYLKVLKSITAGDGKLLGPEMQEALFKPTLTDASRQAFMTICSVPQANIVMGHNIKSGTKWDWGLGGAVVLEDVEGMRKKGTLHWSGLPNNFWWADRETGLCGIYGTQVIPPGDPKSVKMFTLFQKEMFERATGTSK